MKTLKNLATVHTHTHTHGNLLKNKKSKLIRIILNIFVFLLLWIILIGILDYDVVIYDYNPIYLVIGIALYIQAIKLVYSKVLPKIENNKIIPIVILRNFFNNMCNSFSNI